MVCLQKHVAIALDREDHFVAECREIAGLYKEFGPNGSTYEDSRVEDLINEKGKYKLFRTLLRTIKQDVDKDARREEVCKYCILEYNSSTNMELSSWAK